MHKKVGTWLFFFKKEKKRKVYFWLKKMEAVRPQRKPGRPPGAKNKSLPKQREVTLKPDSFEVRYSSMLSPQNGLGTYTQLEEMLQKSLDENWTDDKVLAVFSNDEETTNIENQCHFYSSSKGRVVIDDGSLSNCGLFPGITLSAEFLSHYLHTYTDVENYGYFVGITVRRLRDRARKLASKKKHTT